jgi:glucose-1-phosphate cytidylyltransferase
MKVIILAGGLGSRLGNITEAIPKPMLRVGGKPILWHIMKAYSHYGHRDFMISLGYKSEVIKEYFINYELYNSDFAAELGAKKFTTISRSDEHDWKVQLIDTGLNTLKGARIKRMERFLDDEINMVTYGDGVADIDIAELVISIKKAARQ